MNFLYFVIILLLLIVGVPIGFVILFGSFLYIWNAGSFNLIITATRAITGLDSFVMLAIPLFILASRIMSAGGIAKRLINFAFVLVGHLKGGLAYVNVLASIFFSGMSGTSTGDTAGLGQIEIPAMIESGYSPGISAVITAMSSTIGPIIPPSVPFVIYGALTATSVGKLFLGGAIPGLFLGFSMMILIYFLARRFKYGVERKKPPNFSDIFNAFRKAFLALVTPFIIIGGIVGGVFTPTEAAAVAVFYALIVTVFIYKEIRIKDLPKIIFDSMLISGTIMFIVAVSSAFGWIILVSGIIGKVVGLITVFSAEPWVALLLINIILLILGCFVEITALMIMFAPAFIPIITNFNLDPVHFGVMLTLNLMIGLVTPPVGMAMYITCDLAKISVKDFVLNGKQFYFLLIIVLVIITYFPSIVMFLPNLLMSR